MMNRIELKQEAKGVVRTAAVSAYLFALLYLALTELLQGASVYVNGDVVLYMQTYFPNVPIPSYLYPVALPTTAVTLVAVVCWLLRVLLQGGWVLYHLGVRRGEEMPYATLFDGFGFIGKLILLNIVIPSMFSCGPCCLSSPVSSPATATVLPSITCVRTPIWASWRPSA